MPTKSKRRPPKNAIVLEDVVFKLGVREIKGVIHGQQGMAVFICEEEGIAEPLPFSPPVDAYDREVTTYIRTCDKSIVLELGRNDVPVDYIRPDRGELDVTDPRLISSLFEEQKLRVIPDVISGVGTTIITAVIAVVLFFMRLPIFPCVVVPSAISLWCLVWSLSNYKHLSGSIVYDAVGNWIDLETGKTSLNRGSFRYKMRRDK